MNVRLLKNLKYAAVFPTLIFAFIVTSVQASQAEELFLLFRSPGTTLPPPGGSPRIFQQKILKLDEKGDLLIQCGSARFTVAYSEPVDRFKLQNPQRERTTTINGLSLTARLYF